MKKTLSILFVLSLLAFPAKTQSQAEEGWIPPFNVPEEYNKAIPSAGFTGFDAYNRPYILYNPEILGRVPRYLFHYTRAHEHGHVFCIQAYGDRSEGCADRWAGKELARTNPALLDKVIWFYETHVRGSRFSLQHPSGYELAEILRAAKDSESSCCSGVNAVKGDSRIPYPSWP